MRFQPPFSISSRRCRHRRTRSRDHPRMRGEHPYTHVAQALLRGSSPHARGALILECLGHASDGIIPACAGSTCVCHVSSKLCWDHPRMRGEHTRERKDMSTTIGSSPHARGARTMNRIEVDYNGIIPACAGSTRVQRLVCES